MSVLAGSVSPASAIAPDTILGASIIREFKAAKIEFVVTLPDITTSSGLLSAIEKDRDFRHIKVCKEDEGIGILAGLSFCDKRGVLTMQNTGFFDSINALRGVGVEYSLPICLLVGLVDKEIDRTPQNSKNYGVRLTEPVLDAMGVTHCLVEKESDAPLIGSAIEKAYQSSKPIVILLGRRPKAAP